VIRGVRRQTNQQTVCKREIDNQIDRVGGILQDQNKHSKQPEKKMHESHTVTNQVLRAREPFGSERDPATIQLSTRKQKLQRVTPRLASKNLQEMIFVERVGSEEEGKKKGQTYSIQKDKTGRTFDPCSDNFNSHDYRIPHAPAFVRTCILFPR
jgi:hypothetical protein